MDRAEQAFDKTHKKCLTGVWTVPLVNRYLEGARFTIRMNHDALQWILNMTDIQDI